jgi:hypothetical protein
MINTLNLYGRLDECLVQLTTTNLCGRPDEREGLSHLDLYIHIKNTLGTPDRIPGDLMREKAREGLSHLDLYI